MAKPRRTSSTQGTEAQHARPTKEQLQAAYGKTLPDLIAPNLKVLFCGLNPGLYTAAIQRHFGRPGNRFWPALHAGGFTPTLFSPYDEADLLPLKLGICNFVDRATATAEELSADEFRAGAIRLREKVERYRPKFVAILGVGAYRTGFAKPKATVGLQSDTIGSTKIWLLPNPSGLNAHYQPADLAKAFAELRKAADR